MAQYLTNRNKAKPSGKPLSAKEQPFRIAISEQLENGYDFKIIKQAAIKEFHKFLSETVYKKLTISDVDKLYLRKEGLSDAPKTYNRDKQELLHYGKDRNSFRIFGYYNSDAYFVMCRIDPNHQTHKQ